MTDADRWGRAVICALVLNGAMMSAAAVMVAAPRSEKPTEYFPVDLIALAPDPKPMPPPPVPVPPVPQPVVKTVHRVEPPDEPTVGLDESAPPVPPDEPKPAPEPAYRASGEVSNPPAFLRRAKPAYPEAERRRGAECVVMVELFIGPDGAVDKVVIVESGGESFDSAVKEAIGKSRFSPGALNGRPVGVRVRIPFRFRLR